MNASPRHVNTHCHPEGNNTAARLALNLKGYCCCCCLLAYAVAQGVLLLAYFVNQVLKKQAQRNEQIQGDSNAKQDGRNIVVVDAVQA